MADASVDKAPIDDVNFEFDKKFLGNRDSGDIITLSSWVNQKVANNENNLLLQMDIEGSEFDVLFETSQNMLSRFSYLCIEFHGLEGLLDSFYLSTLSSCFEKLFKNFSIAHIHPNNGSGVMLYKGTIIPKVIEITFIRNDLINNVKSNNPIQLPHKLDKKNDILEYDFPMPFRWWKGEGFDDKPIIKDTDSMNFLNKFRYRFERVFLPSHRWKLHNEFRAEKFKIKKPD
jgi:hypothetical protein